MAASYTTPGGTTLAPGSWLEARRSEIELHYLPSYSPELNPDEGVNADLKQALPRKEPARSKEQLRRAADRHMRSLSRRPQRIRAIFRHPQFRYAAWSRQCGPDQ